MLEPLSQKKHIVSLAIVVFLSLLSHTSFVSAGEIVAVKSSAVKPYNEAVEGFKSTCKCTVRELNLAEMKMQDIKGNVLKSDPDAVFTVGLDALDSVSDITGPPVLYTLAAGAGPEISKGGNKRYGVSMEILPEKYLSTMARLFPHAKRIGLLYNKFNTGTFVKDVLAISALRRFEIIALEISRPGQAPSLIQTLKGKIDIFWILPDPSVTTPGTLDSILLFSFQNNVPVVSFTSKHVKMGALASLSVNPFDLGAQAGKIAAENLNTSFRSVPALSPPQKITLSINRKIAAKMGISFSDSVVREAEEVY